MCDTQPPLGEVLLSTSGWCSLSLGLFKDFLQPFWHSSTARSGEMSSRSESLNFWASKRSISPPAVEVDLVRPPWRAFFSVERNGDFSNRSLSWYRLRWVGGSAALTKRSLLLGGVEILDERPHSILVRVAGGQALLQRRISAGAEQKEVIAEQPELMAG